MKVLMGLMVKCVVIVSIMMSSVVFAGMHISTVELPDSAKRASAEVYGYAPTVLITGSNRGIGLELARKYAEMGWNVIATCRSPKKATELNAIAAKYDKVSIEKLDVTNQRQISALANKLKGKPIDVLLNNAGVLGKIDEQKLGSINIDTMGFVIDVNAFGTLRVIDAFIDNVRASKQKKIVGIGSGMGSSTLTSRRGEFYGYRMSKAALHVGLRAIYADTKKEGILVGIIGPGIVETDLSAASGYKGPMATPEESANGIVGVIADLNSDTAGNFTNYNGRVTPW